MGGLAVALRYQVPCSVGCARKVEMGSTKLKGGWPSISHIMPMTRLTVSEKAGGGGGIRTHGTLSRTPVFKTGAFDHSATPPQPAPPRTLRLIRQMPISSKILTYGRGEILPIPASPSLQSGFSRVTVPQNPFQRGLGRAEPTARDSRGNGSRWRDDSRQGQHGHEQGQSTVAL